MLPRADVVALLSQATVFACPSIYEPLGIVNLEAMACETAVVATATGGIPEVVVHGETGWLVPIEQATDGTGTPLDPEKYVADLAAALVEATADPDRAKALRPGRPGPRPGGLRLAGDRRDDARRLPLGRRLTPASVSVVRLRRQRHSPTVGTRATGEVVVSSLSTIYSVGTLLSRAEGTGQQVRVLVEGQWIDGHTAVL